VPDVTITAARPDQLDAAAAVLAEGFRDDPVMFGFVPRGRRRHARLVDLFAAMMRSIPAGRRTVDVAVTDDDGDVVGAAVWEAPLARPSSPLRLPVSSAELGQLPRYLRALGLGGLVPAVRHQATLAAPRPRLPHWYLGEIAVGDAARGLGVGTSLMEHRLATVDERGEAAYLESSTERNRALYRRMGFVELGPIRGLPGATPAAMWRPATSSRGSTSDRSGSVTAPTSS